MQVWAWVWVCGSVPAYHPCHLSLGPLHLCKRVCGRMCVCVSVYVYVCSAQLLAEGSHSLNLGSQFGPQHMRHTARNPHNACRALSHHTRRLNTHNHTQTRQQQHALDGILHTCTLSPSRGTMSIRKSYVSFFKCRLSQFYQKWEDGDREMIQIAYMQFSKSWM